MWFTVFSQRVFYIVQHQEVGVINYIQVHEKSYIYKRDPNISTTM